MEGVLDLLSNYRNVNDAQEKSRELTAELLQAMGKCLGYDFDKVQVKKGAYYPEGLVNTEQEQHAVRRGILDVLQGKRRIPVGVFEDRFPPINLPEIPEVELLARRRTQETAHGRSPIFVSFTTIPIAV